MDWRGRPHGAQTPRRRGRSWGARAGALAAVALGTAVCAAALDVLPDLLLPGDAGADRPGGEPMRSPVRGDDRAAGVALISRGQVVEARIRRDTPRSVRRALVGRRVRLVCGVMRIDGVHHVRARTRWPRGARTTVATFGPVMSAVPEYCSVRAGGREIARVTEFVAVASDAET